MKWQDNEDMIKFFFLRQGPSNFLMSTRRLYVRFCYLNFFNVKSLVDWEHLHQWMQPSCLFYMKKLTFFYFIYLFLQNTHISLFILHIYSIKYSFFYNFLLFPPSLPLSLTDPQSITTNDHSTPSHHHHHPTSIIKENQPT